MFGPRGTIYLHQPRSTLASPSIQDSVLCTRQMRTTRFTTAQHVHSTKTIQAANKLSDLISLPGSLNDHSPFFICTVALNAMVNLSAYSLVSHGVRADLVKEHVILATGALSLLSETWAVAVPIVKEVKNVARRVFNVESANSNSSWSFNGDVQSINSPLLDNFSWQDQIQTEWPDV